MFRRPADLTERIENARPPPQADKPVAAIARWTEHRAPPPEFRKGVADVMDGEVRNIGPDDRDWSRRQFTFHRRKALAEIARALIQDTHAHWPRSRAVRGHREPSGPAAILAQTTQSMRQHHALKTERLYCSDVFGQAPLAGSEPRASGEDNKVACEEHRQRRRFALFTGQWRSRGGSASPRRASSSAGSTSQLGHKPASSAAA